jgi:hypothetical protein
MLSSFELLIVDGLGFEAGLDRGRVAARGLQPAPNGAPTLDTSFRAVFNGIWVHWAIRLCSS